MLAFQTYFMLLKNGKQRRRAEAKIGWDCKAELASTPVSNL
jgi:hypothetical protein